MTMFNNKLYYKEDSFIHALNPFLKIILVILFIITLFIAKSELAHLFLYTFLIIILIISNITPLRLAKSIWRNRYFLLIVILVDLLIFRSITHMLMILIAAVAFILILAVFILTTTSKDLILLLDIFLSPLRLFKVNTRKIAIKIIKFFTVLSIMKDEYEITKKALKNHDNDTLSSTRELYEAVVSKSIYKADEQIELMKIKNYDFDKNEKYVLYVRRIDYALVSVQILLFIAILIKG